MIRKIKGVPVDLGPARTPRGTFYPTGPVFLVEGKKITKLGLAKRRRARSK